MRAERAEEARAVLLELEPGGFEEALAGDGGVELAAYTDAAGEERFRAAFPGASSAAVAEGWEDGWRAFHRPVRIGPLWVGPPWLEPDAGALPVVVDPGRAFGTGAHATTRLVLEALLELPRGSLLDVGCGSGVLAIAAARLGFGPITAVDVDPAAVAATSENAARNGVSVPARLVDGVDGALPGADVVLANIALASVEAIAPRLRARLLVTSGYLVAERPAVPGARHERRLERDGWAADVWALGTETGSGRGTRP